MDGKQGTQMVLHMSPIEGEEEEQATALYAM